MKIKDNFIPKKKKTYQSLPVKWNLNIQFF